MDPNNGVLIIRDKVALQLNLAPDSRHRMKEKAILFQVQLKGSRIQVGPESTEDASWCVPVEAVLHADVWSPQRVCPRQTNIWGWSLKNKQSGAVVLRNEKLQRTETEGQLQLKKTNKNLST